ncbi:hypothetical protein [uncultured Sphingomonas sp.]|uniref:hypothetical protein n=1 Tax=uncultured Sphingomonas sp. TaxID=158754 RepID=UPI0035C94358
MVLTGRRLARMGKVYSDDLRRRVVCGDGGGQECGDVGAVFDVAPSTAGNWYRRYRRESSHAARPLGGDRRSKLTEHAGWIGERLAETPELTLLPPVRAGSRHPDK